jgi:hypothetical protein
MGKKKKKNGLLFTHTSPHKKGRDRGQDTTHKKDNESHVNQRVLLRCQAAREQHYPRDDKDGGHNEPEEVFLGDGEGWHGAQRGE